jgi:hypothetical protein
MYKKSAYTRQTVYGNPPPILDLREVTQVGDLAESAFERSPDLGDLIDY